MKRAFLTLMIIPLLLVYTYPEETSAQEKGTIQEEIIYNILVDRYNNGNSNNKDDVRVEDPYAYHGGDLKGITKKLDDIKELGFTSLSLSPIMKNATDGYHGYWIEDFYEVDDYFGTMEDLQELISEAHERDMKVILEFVTNYVALSNPIVDDPEKADWIKENDDTALFPWMENVAVLNQANPEVETFLMDAADYWLNETDIDGFKLHAADEASNEFLQDFTAHIKDLRPDFYLIADILHPEDDASTAKVIENPDIQLVEDYTLFQAMTDVFSEPDNPVSDIYQVWEAHDNPKKMLYVDNKYTERFTQKFGENGRNDLTTWKLALTFMYTTPGVPFIYQGSDIPMFGKGFPDSQVMVQFNSGGDDLKEFYHRISSLRKEFPVLTDGDFEQVDTSGAMSVFKRSNEDETIYIAINNDSESQVLNVTDVDSGSQLRGLLEDNIVRENDNGEFPISLPRETAEVYIIEEDTGLNWLFIGLIGGVFVLFPIVIFGLSRGHKKKRG